MHSFILGLTLTLTGLAPHAAFARPIARCQFHLIATKDRLAQIEVDTFDRLRADDSPLPITLRGLMIAVYDAGLDGEPVGIKEGFTFVPYTSITADVHIKRAAAAGLLIIDTDPKSRVRTLRAGPRLGDLIRAEIAATLARTLGGPNALAGLAADEGAEAPPTVRSAALDRLLLKTMWSDFDRVWQPGAEKDDQHLRHTSGLLAHLYQLKLRRETINVRSVTKLIPLNSHETRRKVITLTLDSGLMELSTPQRGELSPTIAITPKGAAYVEGRIDATIDATNAILRKVAEDARR